MATADRPDEVRAIAVVAQSGRDTVVLDADDARCVDLGGDTVARRICYVGVRPENPVIADHVASGGLAVTLAGPGDGKRVTDRGGFCRLVSVHGMAHPRRPGQKLAET